MQATVDQVGGKRSRRRLGCAALVGALLLLAGCGASSRPAVLAPSQRISEEAPPHPRHLDVATPAQERAANAAARQPRRAATPPAPESGHAPPAPESGQIPPASAGTNGSFTPPPASERTPITPRTIHRYRREEAEGRAILLDGIALAPPSAPEAVQAMISAANEIVGRPYIWGGGHGSWYAAGYDCSGAVSYALAGGGLLSAPLDSGQLAHWGAPGPGRWITVYANGGHAYAVVAGLRWDTVGDARGDGPRWHAALPYPQGFVARHPPGY